jgi:hypothetical protein
MGTAGGITIGGPNMWALLLDKDPGDRAVATDLAFDVVDRRKHKKAAVVVKVEAPPPAGKIAKPVKRCNNNKGKKMEKDAAWNSKQAPASKVKKTNGNAGHNRQADGDVLTDMWIRRYFSQEETSKEEEETMFTVVGRRTVARIHASQPSREVPRSPAQTCGLSSVTKTPDTAPPPWSTR